MTEVEQRLRDLPSEAREERLAEEIERMLQAETDLRLRAVLGVMQRLHHSVAAEGRLTRILAERSSADSKLLQQGIGGWKAMLIIGGLVGGLLVTTSGYLVHRTQRNLDLAAVDRAALQKEVIEQRAADVALDRRVDILERVIEARSGGVK